MWNTPPLHLIPNCHHPNQVQHKRLLSTAGFKLLWLNISKLLHVIFIFLYLKSHFCDCNYLNSMKRIRTCDLRLTLPSSYQLYYNILNYPKNSMRRTRTCELRLTGPRTTTDLKNAKKTLKKKSCSKFFTNKKKIDFFSENVFKTLLGGREIIRTRKWVFFEIFPKNMIFFSKNWKNRWK